MQPDYIKLQHSRLSVKDAADRLVDLLTTKGVTIYARINQQEEAKKAGIDLPPLEYLLFGNPLVGGKLMSRNPIVALDLPLKIILWKNEQDDTLVAYNDPSLIHDRYQIPSELLSGLDLSGLVAQIA